MLGVALFALLTVGMTVTPVAGAPSPGTWSEAADADHVVGLAARLVGGPAEGRVLGTNQHGKFSLYDPANDRWEPVKDDPFTRLDGAIVGRTITPGKNGKVLVGHFSTARQQPYLPMAVLDLNQLGREDDDTWTPIESDHHRASYYTATLIDGTPDQCGDNCGKVLVAGGGNDSKDSNQNDRIMGRSAELYDIDSDPPTATLTGLIPVTTSSLNNAVSVLLADGRVLAASLGAYLFDPKSASWSTAAEPPHELSFYRAARLADGRVLMLSPADASGRDNPVLFDPNGGEVDPVTGRHLGSWALLEHCAEDTRCVHPTLLPDGTVLAYDRGTTDDPTRKGAFVFDPASVSDPSTPDWTRVGAPDVLVRTLTLLTGTAGQCGANCGKVLGAGGFKYGPGPGYQNDPGTAQLYTPGDPTEVTAVSPPAGFACGGGDVTISGRGLKEATKVSFGEKSVDVVNVNADGTAITVKSPPHVPGKVDISVKVAGRVFGPSGVSYTYSAVPPPTVTSLSPKRGPVSGATTVTIGGSFAPECVESVSFGDTPAARYTVAQVDPGKPAGSITAISPRRTPGDVRVTVKVRPGPEAPSSSPLPTLPTLPTVPTLPTDPPPPQPEDVFTYHPVIKSIAPVSGPTAGGTEVTILGDGFAGATEVRFGDAGDKAATGRITQRSENRLVAVAPAHEVAEAVRVQALAAGVASLDDVFFTYEAPPVPVDPGGDKDLGTGPPKQDTTPVNPAPPGGSPAPSPGGSTSPSPSPSPTPGPSPAPSPSPVPGGSPAGSGSAVGSPSASAGSGQAGSTAQAPAQAPSQTAGAAGAATAPAPGGPAAAPAQATPGSGGAPGSGQAGVGGDEERGEARYTPRHNMTAADVGLGLGAAGAAVCFSGLALARRRRSARSRPRPRGAY